MTSPEASNKKPRCSHISKTGQRCHADPQTGKDWCFFHDPEKKKQQAEARKQGGETRTRQTGPAVTLPANLPVLPLEKFPDVLNLLEQTINHLLQGEMDVPAARAIGYLAGLQQRAIKANAQPMVLRLGDTINRFRRGEMDLRTAKTIGHLTALMLNAMKHEAQQQKAALLEATRANQPTQANRPEPPRPATIGTVMTAFVAAQSQDDHELHPAVINGNALTTAEHGGIQAR